MTDELKLSPPPTHGPDSFTDGLTRAARSRKGRTLMAKAWPYVLAAATAFGGWIASKADSKAELQEAIALRKDRSLDEQRHAQVMAAIGALRAEMLSQDLREPGRVTRLERGQYFAWRALAEVRAFALAGESPKSRASKELQGGRFARAFDARASGGRDPNLVYEELFAQAAVP